MTSEFGMLPRSRCEGLAVQQIDGEFIVYDLERNVANLLTGGTALLWPLCDGKHDVAALGSLAGLDDADVTGALDQLGGFGLLEGVRLTMEPEPEPGPGRLSRRSVIQRGLAVSAGVGAVSMITAVAIPASAMANTSTQTAKNHQNYAACSSASFTCSPGSVCTPLSYIDQSRCTRPPGASCFYSPQSPRGYDATSVCSNFMDGYACPADGRCS